MSLHDEFKELENDLDRWRWVIENKDSALVICDNDETMVTIYERNEVHTYRFYDSIGSMPGVFDLLGALNIEAESV